MCNKKLPMSIFPSSHKEDGTKSASDSLPVAPKHSLAASVLLITWLTFMQEGAYHVHGQKALACGCQKCHSSKQSRYKTHPSPHDLVSLQAPVSSWEIHSMTHKTPLARNQCLVMAVQGLLAHSTLIVGSSHLFLTSGS